MEGGLKIWHRYCLMSWMRLLLGQPCDHTLEAVCGGNPERAKDDPASVTLLPGVDSRLPRRPGNW